jgi:hypothetical protein
LEAASNELRASSRSLSFRSAKRSALFFIGLGSLAQGDEKKAAFWGMQLCQRSFPEIDGKLAGQELK